MYLDAAYIVRLYLPDPGFELVRNLVAHSPSKPASLIHGRAEVCAAMHRGFREGRMDAVQFATVFDQFEADCRREKFDWAAIDRPRDGENSRFLPFTARCAISPRGRCAPPRERRRTRLRGNLFQRRTPPRRRAALWDSRREHHPVNPGGLIALKLLGEPANVLHETKVRLFAA